MKNYDSDPVSNYIYYGDYYRLNSFPEAMFLIEAECLETPSDTVNKPKSSVTGVMFGLGIIVTLIVGGTWQLQRSLKVTPVKSQVTQPQKLSANILFPSKDNRREISATIGEIEILTLSNTIANSRF